MQNNMKKCMVRSLLLLYNPTKAAHTCRIELHQRADPAIERIHIPEIAKMSFNLDTPNN